MKIPNVKTATYNYRLFNRAGFRRLARRSSEIVDYRCTVVNIRGESYRLKEKRKAETGGYAQEVAEITAAG